MSFFALGPSAPPLLFPSGAAIFSSILASLAALLMGDSSSSSSKVTTAKPHLRKLSHTSRANSSHAPCKCLLNVSFTPPAESSPATSPASDGARVGGWDEDGEDEDEAVVACRLPLPTLPDASLTTPCAFPSRNSATPPEKSCEWRTLRAAVTAGWVLKRRSIALICARLRPLEDWLVTPMKPGVDVFALDDRFPSCLRACSRPMMLAVAALDIVSRVGEGFLSTFFPLVFWRGEQGAFLVFYHSLRRL